VSERQVIETFSTALDVFAKDISEQAHPKLLFRAPVALDQPPRIVELCLHAHKTAFGFVLLAKHGEFGVFERTERC